MATRFIGKNIRKKIVRPMKNSVKHKNYIAAMEYKLAEEAKKEEEQEEVIPQKENKRQKKNKDMVNENKLAQMESIVGTATPNANIKVEKADKGLHMKTEESTIVMTEDNKMLLND